MPPMFICACLSFNCLCMLLTFRILNGTLNVVGGCLLPMPNGEMGVLRSSFHLDLGAGAGGITASFPLYKRGRELIFYLKKKKILSHQESPEERCCTPSFLSGLISLLGQVGFVSRTYFLPFFSSLFHSMGRFARYR